MIKLENVVLDSLEQMKFIIEGMRNPMNSWNNSDSDRFDLVVNCQLGKNDLDLAKKLVKAGTDHRKFMRMITVYCDITAPLYWWKEFDTYKVGTVANSCSTMHKIQAKEFTLDDFSHEHLTTEIYGEPIQEPGWVDTTRSSNNLLDFIVCHLNVYRELYLETKDRKYWWQMIQLLPSSYNQKRTVMLNYEVLANIHKSRKNHKLDEWREFCDWIETLPCSELITGEDK